MAPRRISKIITVSDGGYAVLAPYHVAREGWLAKYQVDYAAESRIVPFDDMTHYTAADRVKLSHHWDGFVQFSGESPGKIVSGRDAFSGQPKGLGIQSAPIRVPITSGPTFGLSVWGIEDFAESSDDSNDLVFRSSDMYYRRCSPSDFSGYMIEGWVFGERMWAGVRGAEGDLRLSVGFRNFEGTGANLEFRVIPLEPPSAQFLGIMAVRINPDFPSVSGFVLNSPSDRRAGVDVANAIMALYPMDSEVSGLDLNDLTFEAPIPRAT